jgi:hypothetical protein
MGNCLICFNVTNEYIIYHIEIEWETKFAARKAEQEEVKSSQWSLRS